LPRALLFLNEIRYFDKSGDHQLALLSKALGKIKAFTKAKIDILRGTHIAATLQ